MANNKVKFNLWNVYYAPLLTNTTSKIEYGTPIAIPGAVSLSLDPTGENNLLLLRRYLRFKSMALRDKVPF